MTSILGLWQVNANDSEGTLSFFLNRQGNLKGTLTFLDAPRLDDLTNISWNDATGAISFVRNLGNSGVTQTFIGFLGDGHADQVLILAGYFTESDISPNAPRTQFGWFARQGQPAQVPGVSISGPFNITELAADLIDNPVVDEGPYNVNAFSLQPPLTIQWTAEPGTTIISPTTPSTLIEVDMTGHTHVGSRRNFQVSVEVTDNLGAFASDQKTVSIDVIGSKGGAS